MFEQNGSFMQFQRECFWELRAHLRRCNMTSSSAPVCKMQPCFGWQDQIHTCLAASWVLGALFVFIVFFKTKNKKRSGPTDSPYALRPRQYTCPSSVRNAACITPTDLSERLRVDQRTDVTLSSPHLLHRLLHSTQKSTTRTKPRHVA